MFVIVWVTTPEHSAYHPAGAQASWVVLSRCSDGSPIIALVVTSVTGASRTTLVRGSRQGSPREPITYIGICEEHGENYHHGGQLPDARDSR